MVSGAVRMTVGSSRQLSMETRSPAVAVGPRIDRAMRCQLKSGKILHKIMFDGLHLKRPASGE